MGHTYAKSSQAVNAETEELECPSFSSWKGTTGMMIAYTTKSVVIPLALKIQY